MRKAGLFWCGYVGGAAVRLAVLRVCALVAWCQAGQILLMNKVF